MLLFLLKIVLLVFWVAIKDTNIGEQLKASWKQITCVRDSNRTECDSMKLVK